MRQIAAAFVAFALLGLALVIGASIFRYQSSITELERKGAYVAELERKMAGFRREINRIADATACTATSECDALPLGAHPNGWKDYVAFSTTNLDAYQLPDLVAKFNTADLERARLLQIVHFQWWRERPELECSEGSCRGIQN